MKNVFKFLSMLLALFAMCVAVSCSSDDDEEKDDSWKRWSTADMCLLLEECTNNKLVYVEKNVPYDYSSMRCYVKGKYYNMQRVSNWYFTLPSGDCYYGTDEGLFLEIAGKACMIYSKSSDNIYYGSATDAYNHKCRTRVQLGSNNPNNPNYGGGSSGSGGSSGGDSGSLLGYTLYKSNVKAKVLTVVDNKVTEVDYEYIDIYKKKSSSSYYTPVGQHYEPLARSTGSDFLGYSISGYNYFFIKNTPTISVNYFYYVSL